MKIKYVYILLVISLVANVLFIVLLIDRRCSDESKDDNKSLNDVAYRRECAQKCVAKIITDGMFYPESYDPVFISVDSVFHGPLTDKECLNAAKRLIEIEGSLPSLEMDYKRALHTLKIFGSSGVFWKNREDKENVEKRLNAMIREKSLLENDIRFRDTSKDGTFIGWQIVHRYRGKTKTGDITICDEVYVVTPDMSNELFRYSIEKNTVYNLDALKEIIRKTLEDE